MEKRVFWVSFRIDEDHGYQTRYNDLETAIQNLSGKGDKWWKDTTSFIMFSANATLDSVTAAIKGAIDEECDIAVIGMIDYKGGRVIGAYEDADIFELAPLMKKA